MAPRREVRVIIAVVAFATVVLAACRPLYIPVIPEEVPVTREARLTDESAITLANGRPRLTLVPDAITTAGWLDVQWFAPNGREAASMSVWLEPSQAAEDAQAPANGDAAETQPIEPGDAPSGTEAPAGRAIVVTLPEDVELVPGEWRALVSMAGQFLRQFRIDVP